MPLDVQQFEAHRPLLFGIAYRMLGSASEAEDAVRDAYLRAMAAPGDEIRVPRAFLSTVVTRLCLDRLKAARVSREQYIGPWLPEPLVQPPSGGAGEAQVERDEAVSVAMLLLLEQLSPIERAVFLLHAAFEFPFDEIGAMIGRSAAACRQAYHRARGHLDAQRPRFRAPPVPPVYPRQSIARDEEGVVLVRALVDPSGAPQRVLVHKGSGFPLLDDAALEAVRRWRFEPMIRDGRATSAWVQVPVRFRLN